MWSSPFAGFFQSWTCPTWDLRSVPIFFSFFFLVTNNTFAQVPSSSRVRARKVQWSHRGAASLKSLQTLSSSKMSVATSLWWVVLGFTCPIPRPLLTHWLTIPLVLALAKTHFEQGLEGTCKSPLWAWHRLCQGLLYSSPHLCHLHLLIDVIPNFKLKFNFKKTLSGKICHLFFTIFVSLAFANWLYFMQARR